MPFTASKADERVLGGLIRGIGAGTHVHAYLFEGEAGLPTKETALCFAAALLCEGAGEPPCGICRSCIQSAGGNHPDLQSLSLSDITSKKSVGADEIRAVISDVYTKPFQSEKKVYIIEDGDALTPQAPECYAENFRRAAGVCCLYYLCHQCGADSADCAFAQPYHPLCTEK